MRITSAIRGNAPKAALFGMALALLAPIASAGLALRVNSLEDNSPPGDGIVTLREAMQAIRSGQPTDLGDNPVGTSVIDLRELSGEIELQSLLPRVDRAMHLLGPGREVLAISGGAEGGLRTRLLHVRQPGTLTIEGLELRNGLAQGGHGGGGQQRSGGGGGGAGVGGAILVESGALALLSSRIRNSAARGGNGGSQTLPAGNEGGGGGGGIGGDGQTGSGLVGGSGGSGAPLASFVGAGGDANRPGGNSSEGAGAGGGSGCTTGIPCSALTAFGGFAQFGGGGGGGGWALVSGGVSPTGGDGGFGGGGGGRGGRLSASDGPGGLGGAFGGSGGASIAGGNVAGGGGGGAGLGGAVFMRAGSLLMEDVEFVGNRSERGLGGSHGSSGGPGQGKAGALFIMDAADAVALRVRFIDNSATDATGGGFTPGQASDTGDVFGVLDSLDLFVDGFEASTPD